jgi:predicted AAA+ superfamily ATPase
MVPPYKKRQERQVIGKAPKFYLFDVGVAGAIVKRQVPEEKGEQFGRAFEHFIFMELAAHSSCSELRYDIHFWRTKSGLEVDFILGTGEVAIEVKGARRGDDRELKSMKAFKEEHRARKSIVVCNEPAERIVEGIQIMPWRLFLSTLWSGDILR